MPTAHHVCLLLARSTLLLSLVFCDFASLAAQDSTRSPEIASLSVVVSDPSGAVVPNAEVAFKGKKTLATKTAEDGSVRALLPYGDYVVTVMRPGFKTVKLIDVAIQVPDPPDLKVVLQVGHYCDDCCDECVVGVQTITSNLPNVVEPKATAPLWSWFSDCDNKKYIGLEIVQGGKVIHRSSFPICPVNERNNATESPQKIVEFSFKGGYVFQGEYDTTRKDTIEGNIWQAGTDPDTILFGLSFSTKKQVLLNTIHVAKVDGGSTSEIDRGLIVRTFPTSKPR